VATSFAIAATMYGKGPPSVAGIVKAVCCCRSNAVDRPGVIRVAPSGKDMPLRSRCAVALDDGLSFDAGRPCARVASAHSGVLGAEHSRQPLRLGTYGKGCKWLIGGGHWLASSLVPKARGGCLWPQRPLWFLAPLLVRGRKGCGRVFAACFGLTNKQNSISLASDHGFIAHVGACCGKLRAAGFDRIVGEGSARRL